MRNEKKNGLDETDRKIRKVMTMIKELHFITNADRIYVSRTQERRGLIECNMCAKAEEKSHGYQVKYDIVKNRHSQ